MYYDIAALLVVSNQVLTKAQLFLTLAYPFYSFYFLRTEWLHDCRSRIVYERRPDNQVLYVLPVEFFLRKLPVVPVGNTETIPFSMRNHTMLLIPKREPQPVSAYYQVILYPHVNLGLTIT